MKENIVMIHEDELRAGTFLIAEGFARSHHSIAQMIRKYKTDFEEFGVCAFKKRKHKETGRPIKEYLLNENQTMLLGTYLKNTPLVREFKKRLIREFSCMRKVLVNIQAQHKDIKWLETREKGKIARLEATDEIKEFKTYATEQGSDNADWYYTNLTKMLNALLFIVDGKFKNLRDMMTPIQLLIVSGGDLVIRKALQDGMKKQTHYKEIYRLAKKRVETFAELHGQSEILSKQLALFDLK